MVQITSVLVATAAFLGAGVSAQHPSPMPDTCTVGVIYCGHELLNNNANFETVWKPRINAALAAEGLGPIPNIGSRGYDATYNCTSPITLDYLSWCGAPGRCQPPNNQFCNGKDSCCHA
ncbi:hypothetical protein SMACR_01488 [Sordaria macrospora]|uniref:WGS project CABT00000000 data, contig 2.4 n=2 Tax=Sordaria macrospora TaxID=5147 RepID=F7VQZ2_SORMK|nr:uncharacterized protein SMAC_01488 [Sordaria macrospora k-hell]KAA8629139.1 hypothetical protein SMACR_01488 [Sordaria macrospora]KAH7634592.1 hypothetical protein B0T09DRAFT_256067 [Sordaria sp. MPI-SDFR-AT-0083]WPJ58625.1 hypothetical protein SMAC4_01488 [Sordaria macrospora]CCC07925.1 unnamed protein product [Sordaria macrospora k-hell]